MKLYSGAIILFIVLVAAAVASHEIIVHIIK
jgi:hypothetical protein